MVSCTLGWEVNCMKATALGLVVLAAALYCPGCQSVRLGARPEVPHDSPRDLFMAYATALSERNYAAVVECMAPSLQPDCDRTLFKMVQFDRKAARLASEVEVRYGQARLEQVQNLVNEVNTICLRAFSWWSEDTDLARLEYEERGDAVLAIDRETPLGLVAVTTRGKWYLTVIRPDSFRGDLQFVRNLLYAVNRFIDRTHWRIRTGRISESELKEALARPRLRGTFLPV